MNSNRAESDIDLSSARGVAMNEEINEAIAGNTLGSDPPRHQHLRSILVRPLMPDAMREVP
jgi:cytochrome P450